MQGLGGLADIIGAVSGTTQAAPTPWWQKLILGGMLGAGELGNILTEHKQTQMQDYLTNIAKNPALLQQMIQKAYRPLSNAFVQNINNRVQADMASRGLAQAPGIFAGTEAQALAPWEQANWDSARQQVMQALGLASQGTLSSGPQPQNLTPLMAMFLRSFGTGKPTTTGTLPSQLPQPPTGVPPGITYPGMPDIWGGYQPQVPSPGPQPVATDPFGGFE